MFMVCLGKAKTLAMKDSQWSDQPYKFSENRIHRRSPFILLVFFQMMFGCSLSEPEPRELRGHTTIVEGIPHGGMLHRGARYCTHCHGANLTGGIEGQPSCYRCHGENWNPVGVSLAPGDHTVDHSTYLHHPSLSAPEGTCANDACHGVELTGIAGAAGAARPSCFLCHDQQWP